MLKKYSSITRTRNTVSMKKNPNYIETVSNLLTRKGVGYRKQASTIATILGLKYNSAKQKLDAKRGINFKEVKNIFKYFNEPFDGEKSHNCVFIMNNIHKRCIIDADNKPVSKIQENETYATKIDNCFVIKTNPTQKINKELYRVNSIEFMSPPKIAILDNNNDILDLLKKIVLRYGIEADIYQNKDDLSNAMDKHSYEAYILDWLLDFNLTAETIIKKIRCNTEYHSTIIILTGEIDSYENNIGEMILNYDVRVIEKPAKPAIISSILLSTLFFN